MATGKLIATALIITAALTCISGCVIVIGGNGSNGGGAQCNNCSFQAQHEKPLTLTAPLAADGLFRAGNTDGAVQIIAADTDQVTVEATILAKAPDEEKAVKLAEDSRLELIPTTDGLKLKLTHPSLPPCHFLDVSFTATVPRSASIRLTSDDGKINITGIAGSITINNDDGNIDLTDVGNPQAAHTLTTDDGHIRITNLRGRFELNTNDGPLTAQNLPEDIKITTDDGNISLTQVQGSIHVRADDANIKVHYTPNAPPAPMIDLQTDDGRVELFTPAGFSAKIDIMTDDGGLRSDLPISIMGDIKPHQIKGTISDGKGTLRIHTDDGPITIKPAKLE